VGVLLGKYSLKNTVPYNEVGGKTNHLSEGKNIGGANHDVKNKQNQGNVATRCDRDLLAEEVRLHLWEKKVKVKTQRKGYYKSKD